MAARSGIADDPPARDREARARGTGRATADRRRALDPHPPRRARLGTTAPRCTRIRSGAASTGVSSRWRSSTPIPPSPRSRRRVARASTGSAPGSAVPTGYARSRAIEGRVRQCASMDGNAAWAATRLGLGDDPRVAAIVERLIAWQWPDGGWNCDKRPGCEHASFNESLPPLRALAAWCAWAPRRAGAATPGPPPIARPSSSSSTTSTGRTGRWSSPTRRSIACAGRRSGTTTGCRACARCGRRAGWTIPGRRTRSRRSLTHAGPTGAGTPTAATGAGRERPGPASRPWPGARTARPGCSRSRRSRCFARRS